MFRVGLLVLALSGCSVMKPPVDECVGYPEAQMRTYCYASKEVAAFSRATAQSLRDGVITREQAMVARDVAKAADTALDAAALIMSNGGDAANQLILVRQILLEVQ